MLVQRYREENRPVLLELFQKYSDKELFVFHSREEADKWLEGSSKENGYQELSMRHLFDLDAKDYAACTRTVVRNSARSIIIRDCRIAMVHSLKYDYYKFPGGGIRPGEDPVSAMIRETREEAGLTVIPGSVKEYGLVHRIQKSSMDPAECFMQDNYYYFCSVLSDGTSQELDDYEAEERFTPEFVKPEDAIRTNLAGGHGPKDPVMLEREARVLEMLMREGYFRTT